MRFKIIAIVAWMIAVDPGVVAAAENCQLAGCQDKVGYIYIPASQQRPKSTVELVVNGVKTALSYKHRVLAEAGIPPVNSVVAIAEPHTPLHIQSDIGQNVDAFGEARPRMNPATNQYELGEEAIPPDLGSQMAVGTKLRVLGYRTWVSQKGIDGQLLFALVKVESEPEPVK